jgi:UDP-N-acetylmuramate--alanine ligase
MYRHIHFIGIGGIGMSGIAQLFLRRGVSVSGSDVKENSNTVALHNLGARIFIGHHPSQVLGSDAVVYSSAIKEDNPEVIAARSAGLPLLRRAEALALLMQDKTVITVTGSHGKTTTTSLVSHLLLEAGMCPTVAIGGVLRNIDTNAYVGEGNFFVAEADESDGSFLCYTPDYSIITNIDREHLDYYKDFDSEIRVFE